MILYQSVTDTFTAFGLIGLAEIGDKSQLVCMTLATRYRHWPVFAGALLAFLLLNGLAILFGMSLTTWLTELQITLLVALIFSVVGILSLLKQDDEASAELNQKVGYGAIFTVLTILLVSEFGDKTQLMVTGLSGLMAPLSVWIGASTAMIIIAAVSIWFGRRLIRHIPLYLLYRGSGLLFLLLGISTAASLFF
jgi:putative Ca2+/H+ antiporter (TMEM165/GDT1 family)